MAKMQISSLANGGSSSISKSNLGLSRLFISIFSFFLAGAIFIAPVSAVFTGYFTEEQAKVIRNSIVFSQPRIDQTSNLFDGTRRLSYVTDYQGTILTSSEAGSNFYIDDFSGRFWSKASTYSTSVGNFNYGSSVKSWLVCFNLNLSDISSNWTLHMIIPAGGLVDEILPFRVGYFVEEYYASSRYYVTWHDLSYTYGSITKYDNYISASTGGSTNYPGFYRTLDIEMPAGDFNHNVYVYLKLPIVYNWTAGFLGVSSDSVAHIEVMEQLEKIAVNQQIIINHLTTITVESEEDAEEVQRILKKMQATTMKMDEYQEALKKAEEEISLPDPDNLVPDIHDMAEPFFDSTYTEPFQGVMNFGLFSTMMVLSLTIAFVSYILFGKKV